MLDADAHVADAHVAHVACCGCACCMLRMRMLDAHVGCGLKRQSVQSPGSAILQVRCIHKYDNFIIMGLEIYA